MQRMASVPDRYPLMAIAPHWRGMLAPGRSSHLPLADRGDAEQPLGPQDDDDQDKTPDRHRHGVAAEVLDRQRLVETDNEAARDGAPDRPDASQHHRGDSLGTDAVPHEGRDVAVVDGEERSGH